MTDAATFVRGAPTPDRAPPPGTTGSVGFLRQRFFADIRTTLLTVVAAGVIVWAVPPLIRYLITDAIWIAPDGAACRAPGAGACWAYIWRKLPYFMFGSYPEAQRWRVWIVLLVGAGLVAWLLRRSAPRRNLAALLFFIVYPVGSVVLLYGSETVGLPVVGTNLWGGIFVSLLVAAAGMVVSLPGGILFALGRRSTMPAVRALSTGFIEIVRGVPLITVLFMANTMLPLFVPEAWAPDRLMRPVIGVALFASAYMAEVIRGGLQALPGGQDEAGKALGLRASQRMRLIILPQALTVVIPGIVNTFIGLFKDTTLVAIVGVFDFLRTVDTARLDPVWAGPTISTTGYVFAGLFYFAVCFGMSRYSLGLEQNLNRKRA